VCDCGHVCDLYCAVGQKKLGKVITPDPWKAGARNTTGIIQCIMKYLTKMFSVLKVLCCTLGFEINKFMKLSAVGLNVGILQHLIFAIYCRPIGDMYSETAVCQIANHSFMLPCTVADFVICSHCTCHWCQTDTCTVVYSSTQASHKHLIFGTSNQKCGPMPNVMAAQPNIGGAMCGSSVISLYHATKFG